jgi:hypothetical protein
MRIDNRLRLRRAGCASARAPEETARPGAITSTLGRAVPVAAEYAHIRVGTSTKGRPSWWRG